jgi:hypothetical protein
MDRAIRRCMGAIKIKKKEKINQGRKQNLKSESN